MPRPPLTTSNVLVLLLDLTLRFPGRQLVFGNDGLEKVCVYRRVVGEGSAWQQVADNAQSPFVDTQAFPPGTTLEYHVQRFTRQDAYAGHSNFVRTTLL